MTISEAINASFQRVKYLLWTEGNTRRWISLGFLGGLAGMSPSLNLRMPTEMFKSPEMLGVLLVVVGFVFLFSLVLGWIACIARFSFLENVIYNRHAVAEPSMRLKGLGTRVFGFYMSILASLVAIFAFVAIAIGLGATAMPKPSDGALAALVLGGLGIFVAVFIPMMLLLSVVFAVTDDMIVPIMYRDNCGVMAASKKFFGLAKGNIGTLILWFLCRMVFVGLIGLAQMMACGAVVVFTGLLVGIVAVPIYSLAHLDMTHAPGIVLVTGSTIVWLALTFIPCMMLCSPAATFSKCFSMYCLEMFDSTLVLLPRSGRGTVLDPIVEAPVPGLNRSAE
jgi:hypothetical protein